MATVTFIEPQTTADIRLAVTYNDTPVDDCTITASIYSPKGKALATNVSVPSDGPSTGTYTLTWLAAWTEQSGLPVEGEYLMQALVLRAGRQRTIRYRIPVRFDDVT